MLAIKKYLLFAFLLDNIVVQSSLLNMYSNYFFYPFLAIGLLCMFDSRLWSGEAMAKFGCLYALMGVYVFYEFVIGSEYISEKTLLYLLAKIVTFGIIITGLTYNESFYRYKALKWIALAMALLMAYSLLTGDVVNVHNSGRLTAGFTNMNTTGSFGALIVGVVLFATRGRRWTYMDVICVLIGIYGVLAGASRSGFLMLGILAFMRYGVSIRTVAVVALVVVLGLYVFPALGIETIGIQRMVGTYEGVEGTNRDMEREAAAWMIAQHPWTGWGFEAQNQGYALRLSPLGSHNGYLESAKQMGLPVAILYFGIILFAVLRYVSRFVRYRMKMDVFFAMVVMILVCANYEGLFVGVHEFATNLFFFSLALVLVQGYKASHCRIQPGSANHTKLTN